MHVLSVRRVYSKPKKRNKLVKATNNTEPVISEQKLKVATTLRPPFINCSLSADPDTQPEAGSPVEVMDVCPAPGKGVELVKRLVEGRGSAGGSAWYCPCRAFRIIRADVGTHKPHSGPMEVCRG